jgi:hypothetical protein
MSKTVIYKGFILSDDGIEYEFKAGLLNFDNVRTRAGFVPLEHISVVETRRSRPSIIVLLISFAFLFGSNFFLPLFRSNFFLPFFDLSTYLMLSTIISGALFLYFVFWRDFSLSVVTDGGVVISTPIESSESCKDFINSFRSLKRSLKII